MARVYDESEVLINGPHHAKEKRNCCCRWCFRVFLAIIGIYALVVTLISPALWVKYNQSIAQSSLDGSVLTFSSVSMLRPTPTGFDMQATGFVSQTGGTATTDSANVTIYYNGVAWGKMEMPPLELKDEPLGSPFSIQSKVIVLSATTFAAWAQLLLQGQAVTWHMSAALRLNAKIGPVSLPFNLLFEKDVTVQGSALVNSTAYDVQVVSGPSASMLNTSMTSSFFNGGYVSLLDVGSLTFQLYLVDGAFSGYLGHVIIPNFQTARGLNVLPNCTTLLEYNNATKATVERFLSQWSLGNQQSVSLVGPIDSEAKCSYLYNTVTQASVVVGSLVTVLVNGIFFDGFAVTQSIYNPLSVPLTQTAYNVQAFQIQDVGSNAVSPLWTGFDVLQAGATPFSCVAGTGFGILQLSNEVQLPPLVYSNISLTVATSTVDYCNALRAQATCCGYWVNWAGQGAESTLVDKTIYLESTGTVNMQIGSFKWAQLISQTNMPFTCLFAPPHNVNWNFWCNTTEFQATGNVCRTVDGYYCHPPRFT